MTYCIFTISISVEKMSSNYEYKLISIVYDIRCNMIYDILLCISKDAAELHRTLSFTQGEPTKSVTLFMGWSSLGSIPEPHIHYKNAFDVKPTNMRFIESALGSMQKLYKKKTLRIYEVYVLINDQWVYFSNMEFCTQIFSRPWLAAGRGLSKCGRKRLWGAQSKGCLATLSGLESDQIRSD